MVICETEMLDVTFKNWEIAIVEVLFKKYKVRAVSIVCSGKRIPFIERDLVKFSLEVKSIFKLWYWENKRLNFLFPHL